MNFSDTDLCTFCVKRLFFHCKQSQVFWKSVILWSNNISSGIVNCQEKSLPLLSHLLAKLKYIESIEDHCAFKNDGHVPVVTRGGKLMLLFLLLSHCCYCRFFFFLSFFYLFISQLFYYYHFIFIFI